MAHRSRAGRAGVEDLPDDEARTLINNPDPQAIKVELDRLTFEPLPRVPPDAPVVGPNPFGVALERRRERDTARSERDRALARVAAGDRRIARRDATIARLTRELDEALDARDAAVATADALAHERDRDALVRERDRDAAAARTAEDRAERAEPPERERHKRGGDSAAEGADPAKRPRSRGADE